MLKKKSVIFLISDLISEESFEASLKILNRKHDCIALQIFDPVEHRWPCTAPVVVEDAETGQLVSFGGGTRDLKKLDRALDEQRAARREICRRARVDLVEIESGQDVLRPVVEFFSRRRERMSH